jgi:hypothetical protein
MAVKTFTTGEVLTAADTNTYLANSGEVLITGGTKSGANSYAFDNVFTSTYQNYKIVVDQLNLATGGRAIRLQFRASGSTNTVANYNFGYNGYTSGGAAYNIAGANQTYAEVGVYIDTASVELGSFISEVFDPQLAKRTRAISRGQGYEAATGWRHGGFEFYGTTAFDGFNLTLSSTGNFSFTYSIYGIRNV